MKAELTRFRFFEPFVGKRYRIGISGKKILVVGASFYCDHSSCKYFSRCTDRNEKDSSAFDGICPEYISSGKRLMNEPSYAIEDVPLTYKRFADGLASVIGPSLTYEEIWESIAFTNYIQFFLPANKGSFRATFFSDLSDRDFKAYMETIVELQPDIIIQWGSKINLESRELNPYVVDDGCLEATEHYVYHMRHPMIAHEISIINPYHPSSSAWYVCLNTFQNYLKEELNRSTSCVESSVNK